MKGVEGMINSKFIKEQTYEVQELYKRRKQDFDEIETIYNKQLQYITKEELLGYWKGRKPTSLIFLVQQKNLISTYIEWIRKDNTDIKNEIKEITLEELDKTLDKDMIAKTTFTRKELLELISKLNNDSDKFICLALFEGIKGEHYRDLFYFNIKDVDKNLVVALRSGRKLQISRKLYIYAQKSLEETRRTIDTGFALRSELLKPTKEYPVRVKAGVDYEYTDERTDIQLAQFFKNKLVSIKKETGCNITTQSLRNSGKIDMIIELAGDRKDYYEVLLENRDKIAERYGKDSSVKKWLLKYTECFYKRED